VQLAGLHVNAAALLGTEGEPDAYVESERALARALSLEPTLASAKTLGIQLYSKNRQWSEVEKTTDRGAGLNTSSNADLIRAYSAFLLRVGRIQDAIPLLERVRSLLPYSSSPARLLAGAYVDVGRFEEGMAEAERAFENEGFERWDIETGIVSALAADNREHLLKWLTRADQFLPESGYFVTAMTESLDDSEAALTRLREMQQQSEMYDYYIISWAAWHGDADLALDALRSAPSPFMFWNRLMQDVRKLEGFKNLLREVGLVDYYREYGWNDFCRPVGDDDFVCE
jgi:tetratricopeptide (TPR) repeat protein